MSILDRFHKDPGTEDNDEATASSAGGNGDLPIANYDSLDEKKLAKKLSGLSQVELDAVLAYESDNKNRPVVIDKLKYLRTAEPLEGYDKLEPDEIMKELEGANGQELRAVRDYERKFQSRSAVKNGVADALPNSEASAEEAAATEEKAERTRSKAGSAETST